MRIIEDDPQFRKTARVERLRVIGFEGVIAPTRTPARLAAIVVDEGDCRVIVKDGKPTRLSDHPLVDLPPTATRVEPPLAYRNGHDLLVLSSTDVLALLKAAGREGTVIFDFAPARTSSLGEGSYTAWLSTKDEAASILGVLLDDAICDLANAIDLGDKIQAYDCACRIVRCAVSDDDAFLAAVAMKRSPHPARAASLVAGYFSAMSDPEREERMASAEKRLTYIVHAIARPPN